MTACSEPGAGGIMLWNWWKTASSGCQEMTFWIWRHLWKIFNCSLFAINAYSLYKSLFLVIFSKQQQHWLFLPPVLNVFLDCVASVHSRAVNHRHQLLARYGSNRMMKKPDRYTKTLNLMTNLNFNCKNCYIQYFKL